MMVPATHEHKEGLPAGAENVPRPDDPRYLAQRLGKRIAAKHLIERLAPLQCINKNRLAVDGAAQPIGVFLLKKIAVGGRQ